MALLKHIPERTCVVCREKAPKESLFRLYMLDNGIYDADIEQMIEGRGIYVCKIDSCLAQLHIGSGKNKKGFKQVPVDPETVTMLQDKLTQI